MWSTSVLLLTGMNNTTRRKSEILLPTVFPLCHCDIQALKKQYHRDWWTARSLFFLFSQNNPSRSESSMGQNKLKHSFFPLHYDAEINIHLPIQNQLYHCKFPHPRVRFLKGCKLTLLSVVGQCPHSGSQSSLRKIYNLCSVGF